ncbi:hypothetical protein B0T26DRAFT_431827 [Lasiosphaeria miniovina]|uniref:Uncharacterized protein n=1 Tax=Lasiosphaeria miniovina TaxID=1954250 RepID=A0AA40DQT4_9PEZI|nr:uncharacterized protein B0T26DRAFT_431827 [Lasiosphaeria miniovina]KAK0710076.1 hypothetical protein B0T26DRAFT_431827 [Lasiosphaeria miniovina]
MPLRRTTTESDQALNSQHAGMTGWRVQSGGGEPRGFERHDFHSPVPTCVPSLSHTTRRGVSFLLFCPPLLLFYFVFDRAGLASLRLVTDCPFPRSFGSVKPRAQRRKMSSKRSPQSPPPPRYHDGLILNEEALKIYPELVPTPPPRVHHDSPASQAPIASRASQPNGRDWDTGLHPIEKRRHRAALFWKRPIVWVVVVAAIIIVVLAGILGAVASGKIKIASLAR